MERLQSEAKTVVIVGADSKALGLIAIQDTPKETSASAIATLKKRGLRTVMITGDNQRVAQAIADIVGIDEVIADVLPSDKVDHIKSLQQHGKVAFVGDGINDAPALAAADLGIAMGSGTDIAIESGGIVLIKNNLQDVVQALALSQKTFSRIKLNLFWAFIYNTAGIPIAAGLFVWAGLTLSPELAGLAMAFSSVSVVTSSLLLNRAKLQTNFINRTACLVNFIFRNTTFSNRVESSIFIHVPLALPGVRVARDGCSSPDTPVRHAVLVDAEARGRFATRHVLATPAVGGAAAQVGDPPQGVVVLLPARDGEIAPVKLGGVVGGVCSDGHRKHRTDCDRTHRKSGRDSLLQGHLHL